MKKEIIKKILLIIIALIIILPISVSAASFSVSATKSIVNPNDQVTLTFSSDTAFSASAISINYDSSKWTLVSNKALQGSEVPNVTASNIKTSISVTTGSIKGAFYQIVLQAKSDAVSGSSTVSVSTTDCWAEDGFTPIEMQKGSVSFTHYVASSDSSLKSLSISNCLIDFKNTVTNYNCPLVDVDSVNISATANDSKATVSGAGNRKLNPGSNILKVIVTAENGSTKTYTININRKDNRNSDSSLSLLIVEGYYIDFRSDNLEYTITVPEDVRQVVVKATPGNSNSKITGIGTLNLSSGTNRFPVVVTAENGNIKTYFLNVLRNEKDNVASSKLIELSYNDTKLDVNKNLFAIGVSSDITSLKLDYKTASKTSTYTVTGNVSFKEGINIVTIKVSDMGVDDTIYTLVVNKTSYVNIESLNNISILANDLYFIEKNLQTELSLDTYNKIKNSKNNLYINSLNEDNGLNYSLKINEESSISEDTNLWIIKSKVKPLTYAASIPSNIQVKLFVDEKLNDQEYILYGHDQEKGIYKIVDDQIKIDNYYIEFTSEGFDEYILSKDELNTMVIKGESDSSSEIIFFFAGSFITIAVGGAILCFWRKKKLKSQNSLLAGQDYLS